MNTSHTPSFAQILECVRTNTLVGNTSLITQALQEDAQNAAALFQLALACAQHERLDDAHLIFQCLESANPTDPTIPYNLGLVCSLRGEHAAALAAYERTLSLAPDDLDALINKGATSNDLKDYAGALNALERATQMNPAIKEAWLNLGIAQNHLQSYEQSIHAYDQALALDPQYFEAWVNRSVPLNALKRYQEACTSCERAIALRPHDAQGWFNHGNSLHLAKEDALALTSYDEALKLDSKNDQVWLNKGVALYALHHYEEALAHYDTALKLNPNEEVWSNKGNALHALKRYPEALRCYEQAIALEPTYAQAHFNLGVFFSNLRQYEKSLLAYERAIQIDPMYAQAWANTADVLQELKRYPEAMEYYDRAIELNAELDWINGSRISVKTKTCDWSRIDQDLEKIVKGIEGQKKAAQPFLVLALTDDPALHRLATQTYALEQFPVNLSLGPIPKRAPSSKIRIGYFSADLNNHAVAILTAQLFETHSRDRFEIIAFSLGADDHSPIRQRLSQAFDQFIDASQMSDRDIAQLARQMGIDIAVDLGGFTGNARMGIFAYRAAPIQLSYIGYLGTLGVPYMDYLIADSTIIPPGYESYYYEKIVRLPSYQVNDSQRKIADIHFTRAKLGLPQEGFVFACFNNNYKILPATFDSWMRILQATPGSVLFLYAENAWVKSNLQKEAKARGVEPHRLVFGERLPADEYLARYQACDLFLDTLPYNAGTTASDALWAGLPVLTLMGQSFASRVAASLLNAIGLPELITTTPAQYEAQAIALAGQADTLAAIKAKLAQQRLTAPLFDTPLFTQHLESAYQQMMERYQAGLEPEDLLIQ